MVILYQNKYKNYTFNDILNKIQQILL